MNEGKPNSKYLATRIPIKYEEIKTNLQKKNKKIANHLISLTFYSPEESICEFMIPCKQPKKKNKSFLFINK